jgi:hypothetical protein
LLFQISEKENVTWQAQNSRKLHEETSRKLPALREESAQLHIYRNRLAPP